MQVTELKEGPTFTDYNGEFDAPVPICRGCKHFGIVDRHYTYCAAQPCTSNRVFPDPKFGKQTNKGGAPDSGCPFYKLEPHSIPKPPRTRTQMLRYLLNHLNGWEELCPEENFWTFRKKNWNIVVYWNGRKTEMYRVKKAVGV